MDRGPVERRRLGVSRQKDPENVTLWGELCGQKCIWKVENVAVNVYFTILLSWQMSGDFQSSEERPWCLQLLINNPIKACIKIAPSHVIVLSHRRINLKL